MAAIEVAYTVSGQGPPLYMVHGIGSRRVTWDGLLPGLEEHFTCVRYDLRGHGGSPVPPVPYSLDDLVEDLEALRIRLGHDRIHVIGHSLGGQILALGNIVSDNQVDWNQIQPIQIAVCEDFSPLARQIPPH